MDILKKLGIPSFNKKELDELVACKAFFDTVVNTKDKRVNKVSRKRLILSDAFDLIAEHFNMGDLNIKFSTPSELDEDYICIENINDTYENIIEYIVRKCIYNYFDHIDTRRHLVSEDDYKLIKLALLNKNEEIIKRLSDEILNELFNNTEYEYNFELPKISKSKLIKLVADNNERNKALLGICLKYRVEDDLFPGQIRAVFSCLSSDVFNKCNIKEKIHLMNLIYNYFSYHKEDRYNKYRKIVNAKFTNIDALNHILYDLSYKDSNNYLSKIRNEKLLEDFKTGFKYIIKNETNRVNVDLLDNVSLKNMLKK